MKKTTKAQKNMDIIAMLKGEPVEHGTTIEDAIKHLEHENELLSKKHGSERKPTAKQKENDNLRDVIMDYMASQTEGKTVSDMMKEIPELEGMSNQKVSALVKPLFDGGKLNKEIVKGRSYFAVSKQ